MAWRASTDASASDLVTADPAKRLMHEMISDAIEVAMQEVAGAASAAQNVREVLRGEGDELGVRLQGG